MARIAVPLASRMNRSSPKPRPCRIKVPTIPKSDGQFEIQNLLIGELDEYSHWSDTLAMQDSGLLHYTMPKSRTGFEPA
jgi:hypothetical protein